MCHLLRNLENMCHIIPSCTPVKNLMMRKQSQLCHCELLEATAKSRQIQLSRCLRDCLVDMRLDLALCIDSRCKLNVVVIFTLYPCAISKCFFSRDCVKQPGTASPSEILLDNKWFLPVFASSNPVFKAGTTVEVEVSE